MARVSGAFDRFRESSDKRERIEGVRLKPLWNFGLHEACEGRSYKWTGSQRVAIPLSPCAGYPRRVRFGGE